MNKFGSFITKYKTLILIVAVALLIPSIIGYLVTKINYNILVYLPKDIPTVKGEKILTDDFNLGAYSISVIDNIPPKEVLKLEDKIKKIDGVSDVFSLYDVLGTSIPPEMLPGEVQDKLYKDDSTILMITFKESISADSTLNAVEEIKALSKNVNIGGMSALIYDTRNLVTKEMIMYVVLAVLLCIVVLTISLDNYIAPYLLLLNIGFAIVYNMGSNYIFGEISYITQAISAVLQLGVTTDFSIFLYHKYRDLRKKKTANDAMTEAISETMRSVAGSSLTTIVGFLALCSMSLTLGKDIGLVMAKGVVFGLITVLTIFPAVLLTFDKRLSKYDHKPFIPKFDKLNNFIINNYKKILIVFILLLFPAYYFNKNVNVYYNLEESLPSTLESIKANKELADKFSIVSPEIILIDSKTDINKQEKMLDELKKVEGIDLVLGYSDIKKLGIPDEILGDDLVGVMKSKKYTLALVNSVYENASPELNKQIDKINNIVRVYDKNAIVAGNGPLTKDLIETSDKDFHNVNYVSILAVFLIMFLVLKSYSLPFILIFTIEFAIFVNMGISSIFNIRTPFIASIVIGTIQLGATIDYAILMTTKYITKRSGGSNKSESIKYAVDNSSQSIFTSAMCFFAATVGVSLYSKLEMISSICNLISRGSLISMAVVILVLPSLLLIFDKVIIKTTQDFKKGKKKMRNKLAVLLLLLIIPMNVFGLSKDETVYVKMNNLGETKYYSVREHLINDNATDMVTMKTGLSHIANLNGNEKFSLENKILSWSTKGNDIYYEGKTDEALPIGITLKYTLNGKEVNPNDIINKKGSIKTTIKFTNNEKHGSVYTPFVIALTTKLDSNIKNIEVTNGMVTSSGESNIITALASPGLSKSLEVDELSVLDEIELSYDTKKFTIPSYYLVVTPKMLDKTDLSVFDNANMLFSKVSTLESASKQIKNGAKELSNGTNEYYNGMEEYLNGIKTLKDYSSKLSDSYVEIDDGINQINGAINEIKKFADIVDELDINIDKDKYTRSLTLARDVLNEISTNLENLKTNFDDHIERLKELANEIEDEELRNAILEEIDSLDKEEYINYLDEALSKVDDANNKIDILLDNTDTIVDNINNLHDNIELLTNGSNELVSGSKQYKDGIKAYDEGMNKALDGANKLKNGSLQIRNGASELSSGISAFDSQGISKIISFVNNDLKSKLNNSKELIKLSKEYQTYLDNEDPNIKTKSTIIILINSEK